MDDACSYIQLRRIQRDVVICLDVVGGGVMPMHTDWDTSYIVFVLRDSERSDFSTLHC